MCSLAPRNLYFVDFYNAVACLALEAKFLMWSEMKRYLPDEDRSVYPPNMQLPTWIIVTVGPFPLQLLWKVDTAHPSVCAPQHLTNLRRDELRRTGAENEFNLTRDLMSRLPRILDEQRAPSSQFHQITH